MGYRLGGSGQRGVAPAAPLVIDDQVAESDLEKIAKTSPARVRPVKVATHETQGELLKHVGSCVGVPKGGSQVTKDRGRVALDELLLSGADRLARALVGLAQDRPARGDLAEVTVDVAGTHDVGSLQRGNSLCST